MSTTTTTKPDDSHIAIHKGGTSYVGPDAMRLLQARMLATHLRLYASSGIRPTRSIGPHVMLMLAEKITGHKYKRGAYAKAAADLDTWGHTMQAALPITDTTKGDE